MKHLIRHLPFVFLFVSNCLTGSAQDKITLHECYMLARTNSVLVENFRFLDESDDLTKAIIASGNLPDVALSGSATYQSDVFALPFSVPNATIPEVPKDQYSVTLNVTQSIYDGGSSTMQQRISELDNEASRDALEIRFYEINSVINNLYFGVLQSMASEQVLNVQKSELDNQHTRVTAGLESGITLTSAQLTIEKSMIQVEAELKSVQQMKEVQLRNLSKWIGRSLTEESISLPEVSAQPNAINRPELGALTTKMEKLEANSSLLQANKRPRVSAIVSGGYGQPNPLNFFETDFQPYYLLGLKLQWKLIDWGQISNRQAQLTLSQNMIDREIEHFERTIQNQADLLVQEIATVRNKLDADTRQYDLQKQIFESDKNRFEQGVLSASDYVSSLNELQSLELQIELDKIQISRMNIELLTLTGNL